MDRLPRLNWIPATSDKKRKSADVAQRVRYLHQLSIDGYLLVRSRHEGGSLVIVPDTVVLDITKTFCSARPEPLLTIIPVPVLSRDR